MTHSIFFRGLYLSLLTVVACSSVNSCVYGSQYGNQEQKEESREQSPSKVVFHADDVGALSLDVAIDVGHNEASLAQEDFLPSQCSVGSFDDMTEGDAIVFLKYLGSFKTNDGKSRSLFTKEDQQVFDHVFDVEKRTKWWLRYGQAAILGSALSPMIGFVALSNNISGPDSIVAISVATTFAGLINAWLAFYATGTLPDEASRKANDRQYKFAELQDMYNKVARVLIDLYFSDVAQKRSAAGTIAHDLAKAFDTLRATAKEKVGYDHADNILCPIKAAIEYVLRGKKLKISTSVYDYIVQKETQPGS